MAQETEKLRTYIDLQIHPTMHVPYPFFGKGLEYFDKNKPPKESWKHQLHNVNYANYLRQNEGARVIVNGALTAENVATRQRARRVIMEQIDYVNDFARAHSEDFVVARTPGEVRQLVSQTSKTVIVHSIEGGKKLINSPEDARFWAEQGVAFITLVHLVDYRNGAAAIKPGFMPALINFGALFRCRSRRGLTRHGQNAIRWLADAGVMTDLTHMNDSTRSQALRYMAKLGIPPLVTHDLFKPIHAHGRGVDTADVLRIYAGGGLMSLPVSGESCKPFKPGQPYRAQLDSLKGLPQCYCEGSVDSYRFSYEALQDFIQNRAAHALYDKAFEELTEQEKVHLSIGFQSDFNGWLNHSRPRYGKQGCWEAHPDSTYYDIETQGLAHPGLLSSQWDYLESRTVDLEPIRRSAEKFLQMWQFFLDNRGRWKDSE